VERVQEGRSAVSVYRQIIKADFGGLRRDLPGGREWTVTTQDKPDARPHVYPVSVWEEPEAGRVAKCVCRGFHAGHLCRHIKYVQPVDALLFSAENRPPSPIH
jgi:hypothetical protein